MATSTKTALMPEAVDLLAGQLSYSATGDTVPFKLWGITKLQLANGEAAVDALATPIFAYSRSLRSYVVHTGAVYKHGPRMERLYVIRRMSWRVASKAGRPE